MQLTKNFNLEEFIESQEAVRRGIDNSPNPMRYYQRMINETISQ